MTATINSSKIQAVNFIAGFALLVMLFPHGDKLPEKPAGVRTSIEMIANKVTLKPASIEIAAA
jgi:hypothetical protein